jgi:hypothetical protein
MSETPLPKKNVLMVGEGLLTGERPMSIECGQCGRRILEEIHELDSWVVGLGWADLTWAGAVFEHVCDPQPTERSRVLLNVSYALDVMVEAVQVIST